MSILLMLTLAVLLVGTALSAILAWRRPRHAPLISSIALAVALLVWLVAGRKLPLTTSIDAGQNASGLLFFDWNVEAAGWQLSFYLLLMISAVAVASLAHMERQEPQYGQSIRQKALWPMIPLTCAAALLPVWAGSAASLLVAWVILSVVWLFALWSMTEGGVGGSRLLPRAAALLLGALFLWLAIAASDAPFAANTLDGPWSGAAAALVLLAAIAPLGALPLQWWRPLAWSLPPEYAAIIHLAPVAAGGSLLARTLGSGGGHDAGLVVVATLLGLVSLLAGISIAWMYVASPSRSLSGLALAQAGVVILAAFWVGSAAAIAATQVLILAISGLFLAARWSPRRLPWPAILPVLALAGFPLTAGATGLSVIYNAWLERGNPVLLLLGALLSMFLLAAGMLAVRREMPEDELVGRSVQVRSRHYLALALPSLGLLTLSLQSLSGINFVTWLVVLVALGGGAVLNRFEAPIQDAQLYLRSALHLGFVFRRTMVLLGRIGSSLDSVARETAAILEGEGGMLWLLVFLVVIWLARRS